MIAEKIKKSILQAAIQGKLTEQLQEDGDSRDLLEEIQKEKVRLIKEGKIRKEKTLPEITEDEIPFDIPDNWIWVRLGEISDYGNNKQIKPHDIAVGSWVLELADIEKETYKLLSQRTDRTPGSSKNKFETGDVLYGKLRPYLKKAIVAQNAGYCSTEIMPFHGYNGIDSNYLKYCMVSPSIDNYVNQITHGMDMPRLGTNKAKKLLIPLPPSNEQQRIVRRIEDLLPEIDKLKKVESKLDVLQKAFPTKMKNSILQYAIQGKLTEQLISDGDAHDLLKEIQKEKIRLIKEGKIRKGKTLPEITEDEIPFDIPDNWCWVRLESITSALGDGIHGTPKYTINGEYRFINGNNLINGKIEIKNNTKAVNETEYVKYQKPLDETTVLVSINGTIGNVAFYNQEKIILGKSACYFNLLGNVSKHYLKLLLNSDYFMKYAYGKATGSTIKNVSLKAVRQFPVPLPPIIEQKRIVERLESILPEINKLKNEII